eukprot:3126481-Prymnesium_polylepis.1
MCRPPRSPSVPPQGPTPRPPPPRREPQRRCCCPQRVPTPRAGTPTCGERVRPVNGCRKRAR